MKASDLAVAHSGAATDLQALVEAEDCNEPPMYALNLYGLHSPAPFRYRVHRLSSSSPNVSTLVGKYAQLRLSALTVASKSFGSTYHIESSFSPERWLQRTIRPGKHVFVCVQHTTTEQSIEQGLFVGSILLMGPLTTKEYTLAGNGAPEPGSDGVESKWHLSALFTEPYYRGKGLGSRLVETAVEYAKGYDTGPTLEETASVGMKPKKARVRLFAAPESTKARALYQTWGFKDAGKCTLAEAAVANGDGDLLPVDGGVQMPEMFHKRDGIAMERIEEW